MGPCGTLWDPDPPWPRPILVIYFTFGRFGWTDRTADFASRLASALALGISLSRADIWNVHIAAHCRHESEVSIENTILSCTPYRKQKTGARAPTQNELAHRHA